MIHMGANDRNYKTDGGACEELSFEHAVLTKVLIETSSGPNPAHVILNNF